jgi:predicted membrane-bound spermidine synthase
MLWTIAIIFVLLWVLGLVTSYTLGGFIHLLVAAAVVLLLVRIIKGRGHKRPGHANA